MGGKACYKLVLTPNDGAAETRYYDKSSNLLVKAVMPVTTPQGAVTAEMVLGDYRDEGGILTPHTITQKLPNAGDSGEDLSVKHNPDIPASRFDLPAEIKALMTDKKPDDKKAEEVGSSRRPTRPLQATGLPQFQCSLRERKYATNSAGRSV